MVTKSIDWLTGWLIGLGVEETSSMYLKLVILLFILFILSYVTNLVVKKILVRSSPERNVQATIRLDLLPVPMGIVLI